MDNKVIIAGHLEYGSERNYQQVVDLFIHRKENYYRGSVMVKAEDIFREEERTLDLPRSIFTCSNKEYLNTVNLLKQIAQFGISGNLYVWRIVGGQMKEHLVIEPEGDKTAIQAFMRGRQMVDEKGKEAEAKEALSKAIKKFGRHAQAYERRGFVNFRLDNLKDALYDYDKSLKIDPGQHKPYYGRALVHRRMGNLEAAAEDLAHAIKLSIPHQSIYWWSRALRGDTLLSLNRKDEALTEYRYFLQRRRDAEDPVLKWERRVATEYGKLLLEKGDKKKACEVFERALAAPADKHAPDDDTIRALLEQTK